MEDDPSFHRTSSVVVGADHDRHRRSIPDTGHHPHRPDDLPSNEGVDPHRDHRVGLLLDL